MNNPGWKIKYLKGDLVRDAERDFDVIGHGCNCYCTMGAGIALDVKKTWPEAYEADRRTAYGDSGKLGTYSSWTTPGGLVILNLYTQWQYRGASNDIKADYDAIRRCMKLIKQNFYGQRIGLPLVGAGLAGGDWGVISEIIEEELFGEDVTVVIWEKARDQWQLDLLEEENDDSDRLVILETWTESEAGWGQRPDGASLHLNKGDYTKYVDEYWKTMPDEVPNEYSRPNDNPSVVKVSYDLYKKIKNSNNGIRLLTQEFNNLKKEGAIEYIL
jgi:O-acetyl-ADP-ribose deacetylase (regulator of RNase III)